MTRVSNCPISRVHPSRGGGGGSRTVTGDPDGSSVLVVVSLSRCVRRPRLRCAGSCRTRGEEVSSTWSSPKWPLGTHKHHRARRNTPVAPRPQGCNRCAPHNSRRRDPKGGLSTLPSPSPPRSSLVAQQSLGRGYHPLPPNTTGRALSPNTKPTKQTSPIAQLHQQPPPQSCPNKKRSRSTTSPASSLPPPSNPPN